LKDYNFIIVNEFLDHEKIEISKIVEKLNICTLFLNTNGLIGSLRI